jgi:hypothetical protein
MGLASPGWLHPPRRTGPLAARMLSPREGGVFPGKIMQRFRRIFALVPDCHAGAGRHAGLWRRHFYEGMAGVVPEVIFPVDVDFTWARPAHMARAGPAPERTRASERLWQQIRMAGADAVISYCFATDLDLGLVRRTIESGVPWVNFYCDSVGAFDRVESLARTVSLNWFPECEAESRYRAVGRPWLCRPYALNPHVLAESICNQAVHSVAFVGAAYAHRVIALASLRLRGCRVTVRGDGWRPRPPSPTPTARRPAPARAPRGPRVDGRLRERVLASVLRPLVAGGGPLDAGELPGFVSTCRIILGLNGVRDASGNYRSYLKSRDVEFPGYGACYLTEHNEDIARAFDVGREVLTFRSLTEAAARAKEIGANAARAREIGRAARRRVLEEHTWTARLAELARCL